VNEVTRILEAVEGGEPRAAEQLLPLVYDELRRLAAQRLAHEKAGQTLQATALVHEAYLRLVGDQQFDHRGHFFAAAAEAMRRILVEKARRKKRLRHGGDLEKQPLDENEPVVDAPDPIDLIALDEALARLDTVSARRARLVKLRYFAGLTLPEAAELLGISQSTAEADWTYAKAWLKREMEKG
jgi:RNA polymerase sigma factor (TIGR02999 family)